MLGELKTQKDGKAMQKPATGGAAPTPGLEGQSRVELAEHRTEHNAPRNPLAGESEKYGFAGERREHKQENDQCAHSDAAQLSTVAGVMRPCKTAPDCEEMIFE